MCVCVCLCVCVCKNVRVCHDLSSFRRKCNLHMWQLCVLQLDHHKDKRLPSEKKEGGKESYEWNKGKNKCEKKSLLS